MTDVPSVEQVASLLGRTDDISIAYEAEVADQATRCEVDPYNPALAAALVRRVARALAIGNLPLGVVQDELSGTTRVGFADPEIRRLEAPYRKFAIS